MSDKMKIEFDSKSENESFSRVVASSFAVRLEPTLSELADIKTAVSEAVTNCVVHGYEGKDGIITMTCMAQENKLTIVIEDKGRGIADIEKAMEPLFTTKPSEDRAGMGFSFMEAFMDDLKVYSKPGEGTRVVMEKIIGKNR